MLSKINRINGRDAKLNNAQAQSLFLEPVSKNEIVVLISKLKNKITTGPDGISSILIKSVHQYLLTPLLHIINLIFKTELIPKDWKESIVVPVYKSGEKSNLTNYRPISLINNFSKFFELCLKIDL